MKLYFKHWAESIFGSAGPEGELASQTPLNLNKIQNGAFPSYEAPENDPLLVAIKAKRTRKQMKR